MSLSPVAAVHPVRAAPRLRWSDVGIASMVAEIPSETWTTAAIEASIRPLYRTLGFKPGWVETVTGIQSRRMWPTGQRFLDGAVQAGARALREAGLTAADVGLVLSCSVYRDRLEPGLACEVAHALGVPGTAGNHDVANACLGFLTGMVQAANMIALGQIDVALVVTAEDARPVLEATLRTLTAPSADIHAFKGNLATLTLGSAAAAAVLVRRPPGQAGPRLIGGATRSATWHFGLCVGSAEGMQTDSVALLREGVALARDTWADTQAALEWSPATPGVVALHQVGRAHHEAIVRALNVPAERAPATYPWLGNIGSAAVPVAAALARSEGKAPPGTPIGLLGIGSGLNCLMLGMTA